MDGAIAAAFAPTSANQISKNSVCCLDRIRKSEDKLVTISFIPMFYGKSLIYMMHLFPMRIKLMVGNLS